MSVYVTSSFHVFKFSCLYSPRAHEALEAIIQEAKDPKTIAEKVKPLADNGTNQHARGEGFDIVKPSIVGGNSASYLTARIARDNPEVLEKMKAGEYPSSKRDAEVFEERPAHCWGYSLYPPLHQNL